ncbi:hypothetical protein A1D17_28720 [Pseudomonas fluorescens]|uniref:Uncharacterized protein n=1 Tax=Pseudomonas fluorescens TaxID=294 RepID=A0A166Q9Y2_PSEFL|nr:hypothetical protein A1D17_28720 [Pseudomonas fluorescens]
MGIWPNINTTCFLWLPFFREIVINQELSWDLVPDIWNDQPHLLLSKIKPAGQGLLCKIDSFVRSND